MGESTLKHTDSQIGISDEAQDILEQYWIERKEKKSAWAYGIKTDDAVVPELVEKGIAFAHNNHLELTDKGFEEAKSCVRRHRLAERLFADVLHINGKMNHDMGCKLEHLLQEEVEENICTLLGHPTQCPHDKPIPPGQCCREERATLKKLMRPLSECDVNEEGKIAYLKTDHEDVLNKLTAMGVLPGLNIRLLKRTPGFLFKMGQSQFVVDRELASKIQVRFSKN